MENIEAAAKSDAADKNSKAAIQRCNTLEVRLAAMTEAMLKMEQNYVSLQAQVQQVVTSVNLVRAQTSYTQIEQRILPKIMEEIAASKDD